LKKISKVLSLLLVLIFLVAAFIPLSQSNIVYGAEYPNSQYYGTIAFKAVNLKSTIKSNPDSFTISRIYSMVNSSSISTYKLPEAEEFTIGPNNISINYIVLYLSGSGSVKFSIGSALWLSNILSNTTVKVLNGKLWYNITLPTKTLNGNVDYYLNVYQNSGTVEWGYTSNPSSSSKNYVEDYWYLASGTLVKDDSNPDIYTIGSFYTYYDVKFTESGLPGGTEW
jgi:hypothetical protein